MEYLVILTALAAFALVLWYAFDLRLFASRRHAVSTVAIYLAVGIAWDTFAIARGHWSFGERYLVGVRIGYMPIEEYLFVVIVPLWVLTVYRAIEAIGSSRSPHTFLHSCFLTY